MNISINLDDELYIRWKGLADQRGLSLDEQLRDLLDYFTGQNPSETISAARSPQEVQGRAYARARRYWAEQGESVRAKLTDEELADQFWCFDHGGIPRLKADQAHVKLERRSLLDFAAAMAALGAESWRDDLSADTNTLLGQVMAARYQESQEQDE